MTAVEAVQEVPGSRHFINGEYVESSGSARIEVRNPATGDLLATVPDASAADVDRAVAAARASLENRTWRGKDSSEKELILWRLADRRNVGDGGCREIYVSRRRV